jgi:formylglycine-generating enzyme required for sulfatase activity
MKKTEVWATLALLVLVGIGLAIKVGGNSGGSAKTPAVPTSASALTRQPTSPPAPTKSLVKPTVFVVAWTSTPEPTRMVSTVRTSVSPKDGMVMVFVPAGEFLMGSTDAEIEQVVASCSDCKKEWFTSEMPQHIVYLNDYWMDQTEVTVGKFGKFIEETQFKTQADQQGWGYVYDTTANNWQKQMTNANWRYPNGPAEGEGNASDPVVQVNWNDAQAYCEWAGRRLPTEAEWEKAARGEKGRIYPWGDLPPAGNLVNFADKNSVFTYADKNVDDGYAGSAPVGSYPEGASPYGTLDMAGNVWEWVADWFDASYYQNSPPTDPSGPTEGSGRVLRGGAWDGAVRMVRAPNRIMLDPVYTISVFGFRCAATP